MSDSDETVGYRSPNVENEIENEENSPSLLSNWCKTPVDNLQEKTWGKKLEDNIPLKDSRKNPLKIDVNDFSLSSGSPEFPLSSCGLKRKEHSNETSLLNFGGRAKVLREEVASIDSHQDRRVTNSPKNMSVTPSESQGDEMTKTVELLANVEAVIVELENKNSSDVDGSPSSNVSENVKSQLAASRKALVEANHRNQIERKKIMQVQEGLSDVRQQLSEEKRQALLSLARKQRNLLTVFKNYKNLVQRLKAIKEQQGNGSKEKSKGKKVISTSNKTSLQTRKRAMNTGVSLKSNAQRPSHHGLGSTTLTHNEENVKTSRGIKPMHQASRNVNPTMEPLPAVSNETRNISNSSGITISQTVTHPQDMKSSNNASVDHHSKNHASTEIVTNQSISKQRVMTPVTFETFQNGMHNRQAPSQKTSYAPSCVPAIVFAGNRTSTAQTNTAEAIHPNNANINVSCTRSVAPLSTAVNISQGPEDGRQRTDLMRTNSNWKPAEKLHGNTTSIGGNSQSNQSSNQSVTKQISGALSLETLVKEGVLISGRNVLTALSEGKLYSASLSEKGTIISAGGEGFTSPRSWVKAILGSRRKIKNEAAWKMVSYKGKSLLDYAHATITKPPKEVPAFNSSSLSKNADSDLTNTGPDIQRTTLINSGAALSSLLRNCRVSPIAREELVPTDEILTNDFWERTEFEL